MTETQKGNLYIILGAFIWSFFPIITVLGLHGISSITALFWVTAFSCVVFFIIMVVKKKTYELRNTKLWLYAIGISFFIGILFYGLYFYGLTKTSPGNASLVAMFEIAASYLFFQVIRKEKLKQNHIFGIIFAVIGTLFILIPKAGGFNIGDLFVLGAVCFAPIGNLFQQKAREIASAESILFLRTLLTTPILFLFTILLVQESITQNILQVLPWLLVNGVLLFGVSKLLWIEGIHRMSVTKALAVGSLGPASTLFFAWVLLGQIPTFVQLISLPILIIATLLLTGVVKLKKETIQIN